MNNSIRINCSTDNLRVVRDFVLDFLHPYALSEIVLNQIKLAVDEIAANIIIHSNQEDETKYLKLNVSRVGECFLFELHDQGIAFNPKDYQKPNIKQRILDGQPGGMGIALVERIMDKVEYETQNNHNVCRLYKEVKIEAAPDKA